jgi:hypothetical protein
MNADAGDIDPADWVCTNQPNFAGGPVIAQAVMSGRSKLVTAKVEGLLLLLLLLKKNLKKKTM